MKPERVSHLDHGRGGERDEAWHANIGDVGCIGRSDGREEVSVDRGGSLSDPFLDSRAVEGVDINPSENLIIPKRCISVTHHI